MAKKEKVKVFLVNMSDLQQGVHGAVVSDEVSRFSKLFEEWQALSDGSIHIERVEVTPFTYRDRTSVYDSAYLAYSVFFTEAAT